MPHTVLGWNPGSEDSCCVTLNKGLPSLTLILSICEMKTMLTWTARRLLDQVEHVVMVD